MINDVPDKTIVLINKDNISLDRVNKILYRPSKKRDWFTPHFYNCLPLSIANQYAIVLNTEYSFDFVWNGGMSPFDIKINYHVPDEVVPTLYPKITSHFGSGILTIECPFILKTPDNVNIMTVNPPNYIIPNITTMNGVVETDNLKFTFTFNLKIQEPNVLSKINANTPIAAFITVPRNFSDEFILKNAENIFTDEEIKEELDIANENSMQRQLQTTPSKNYLKGMDVRGNKFNNHQK
jgi:hypothetical protein